MKYTTLHSLTIRLAPRLKVVEVPTVTGHSPITGIASSTIGSEIIEMIANSSEEFIDLYLSMIYVMPLQHEHAFVRGIAEKLIISETLLTYFPSSGESESNRSYPQTLRQTALDDLQCLVEGTGIFVPGSATTAQNKENDERAYQQQVRNVILPGETVKSFIGHDFNDDGVSDSDLFKQNTVVSPSFYLGSTFDEDLSRDVVNGVRVRPTTEEIVDFW